MASWVVVCRMRFFVYFPNMFFVQVSRHFPPYLSALSGNEKSSYSISAKSNLMPGRFMPFGIMHLRFIVLPTSTTVRIALLLIFTGAL